MYVLSSRGDFGVLCCRALAVLACSLGSLLRARGAAEMPKAYVPVSEEPDDLSDINLGGRGIPDTYKAFVKAMLPKYRNIELPP